MQEGTPAPSRPAALSRTLIDWVGRYFHCTTVGMQRRRSLTYALMAAVAAVMGLLLLRAPFRSGALAADFLSNRYEFIYLFAAIAVTFLTVGYVLGRQADKLRRLSSTDVLTGLSNRRALDQHLRDECARAARYRSPLALLLIDLDGLKQVNDAWGHAAGDDILHRTGIAIQQSLRESDAAARWGGDEFAIVAPETSREPAMRLADRLRAQLQDGAAEVRQRAISASIGIAIFDPDRNDRNGPEALMRAADEALYAAKAGGRNQVKVA
jgi:diguanylate cyclase (GGDEF)-like protein